MSPIVETIAGLVLSTLKSILPETPEDKLKAVELAIQQQLANNELLKAQIEVNKAEASQENRKFPTFRELVGYFCALGLGWAFVVRPVLDYLLGILGVDASKIPQVELVQMLKILLAMLGISG